MAPRPPLVLLLAACQAPMADDSGFTTPAITSVSAPMTTGSPPESTGLNSTGTPRETGESSTSSEPEPDTTTEPSLDLGVTPDMGDLSPIGCGGKIDFLFVISRSNLMEDFQTRLIAAFPAFIDTIESKFADFDYHIMVVDGDSDWGLSYCNSVCPDLSCKIGDDCCPLGKNAQTVGKPCCDLPEYPCQQLDLVDECDNMFGAGNVFPAGWDASNKPCPVEGDRRYLVKGQSNLHDTFDCIARVGLSGDGKVAQALVSAMQHEINHGGCNDGFLRDDALLMVTIVESNPDIEPPFGSPGTPTEWAQAVLDAKHGDPESVVVLNIFDSECPWYDNICKMAMMFPYHHIEDMYALDYGAAFNTATALVETACASFVPPPG